MGNKKVLGGQGLKTIGHINTIPNDCNFDNIAEKKEAINKNMIKDLRILVSYESNESFFGESGIVMDRQGGAGKTYNSAKLILHTVLHTNKRILFSTTINENLERLFHEMLKIVTELYEESELESKYIDKFLDGNDFKTIGIYKMNGYNSVSEEKINESRALIINHTYGYQRGLSSRYFKNIEYLRQLIAKNDIIIIDEFHEFVKKSIVQISLNNFYVQKRDEVHGNVLSKTSSPFKPRPTEEYENDISKFRGELPFENRAYTYNKSGDFNLHSFKMEYNPKFEGNNIKKDFLKCLTIEDEATTYDVRAKGIFFDDGFGENEQSYRIRRYYVVQNLRLKETLEDSDCEFISDILYTMAGGIFITQHCAIDRVVGKDAYEEMQSFSKREQLFEFIRTNFENWNQIWDEKIYKQLNIEGRDTYKEYFVFRQKSIFDTFNCKKYYMTATTRDLEKWGFEVNREFSDSTFFKCDYEVLFIQREKGIDGYINKLSTQLGKAKYLDVLSFNALSKNIEDIINKKDDYKIKDNPDYKHVDVFASIGDYVSHAICSGGDMSTGTKKTCRLAYLNGTESTGKNYPDKNVVVINSRPEKNIKGRVIIKDWGSHEIIDLDDIDLSQATFRIHRGTNERLKFIIFVGDNIDIAYKYINSRSNSSNTYTLIEVPGRAKIESISEYISTKIGIYNHGTDEEMPTFDRRQNGNTKTHDLKKVKELYLEAKMKYLEDNPGKKKLTLRIASEILGIDKSTLSRAMKK